MNKAATAAIVQAYIAAKEAADAAEARVKELKKAVLEIAEGREVVEGETAKIKITVGMRTSLDGKLVAEFLTEEQVAACTKRGAPYEILTIRPLA